MAAALSISACGDGRDRPSWPGPPQPPGTGGGFDAGVIDGAPPADAAGFCGNEFHSPSYRPPNLYFVFDRSGSMAELVDGSVDTRYDRVRAAALDLVRTLGPLINVGAALLPFGNIEDNPCTTGQEVFPVTRGDPVTGEDGPTTRGFAFATLAHPRGGTPVAATLRRIYDKLRFVKGNTVILLATDGAPNCNFDTSCGIDQCIPHIEGVCGPSEDCCAPGGDGGPQNCIDRNDTLAAISALGTLGIEVYVIGIPGSAVYVDVLNAMAEVGGTAQDGDTKYHKVDDLDQLSGVLTAIAAATIRCDFVLTDPPEEPDMTNVYLDGVLVPYDEQDGWTWQDETTDAVVLHGDACDRLKNGGATTVQVVTGCPTETPR